MLHLVRHGRPLVRATTPPHEWELDPAGYDDVWALRDGGRLPARAAWFSSPEPKALQTAGLLTDGPVGVVEELREHARGVTPWFDDPAEWRATVARAFTDPERPSLPGWEPLAHTRTRLLPAVQRILDGHADDDVVLVGHGTAWTLLVAELAGALPDLDAWERLQMPDLITVEPH
jgi:broad specificity phosphatase PhoE